MIRLALLASVAVLPLALAAQDATGTGTGTDSATGGNGVAADAATDPLAEAIEGTDPLSEAATDPVATPVEEGQATDGLSTDGAPADGSPEGGPATRGRPMINLLPLAPGETISTVLALPEDEADQLCFEFAKELERIEALLAA